MRTVAGVHHVDIVVASIERSLPFYRDLLAPLGYHRVSEVEGERGETIYYLAGPDVTFDRYRVGLHHVAFEAWSRSAVDDRAAWLRGHDATIESGPEEYSYIPG